MLRVHSSTVIDAPIDAVWALIRDFGNVGHWHPTVQACEIVEGASGREAGCVRHLTLHDGSQLREQVLALSDDRHAYTYAVLTSPLPIAGYVAAVALAAVTEGDRTFAQWTAEFEVTSGPDQAMIDAVLQGLITPGFAGLREHAAARPAR